MSNNYSNGRRGRGGRRGEGGGRSRGGGRGRGSARGRGYHHNHNHQQQQDYSWTSGESDSNNKNSNNRNDNSDHVEPEDFPLETQTGLLFGLSDEVVIPGSVHAGLLQGEILETLKRLPPDICNLMLAHFDKCAREGGIRNKTAYLLGIINSGPRMGLPTGVVVPASVKFSLMQGVVLDDLLALPVPLINVILGEFDDEMRQRGHAIQDRYSFLAEIIRKHKPADSAVVGVVSPESTTNSNTTANTNTNTMANTVTNNIDSNKSNGKRETDEGTLKLLSNSMQRIHLLTESVSKVTAELVAEKEKRSSFEAIAKSEQVLREAVEERLQTALADVERVRELREKETAEYRTSLKYEKDRRVSIDKEIKELKEKVQMERAEKHRAEDRLSALEEMMIAERAVRDDLRNGAENLPDINSADFDSDCESK